MLERYIVVATDKLPRGIYYVGDLRTDVSKRNSSVDPPAQTRYLTPPQSDLISVDAVSGNLMQSARGIGAYLAARVQPGGLAPLMSSATVAGIMPGDTLTIATVVLTAATTEDESKGQFLDSATATSDALSAASLAKVLQSTFVQGAIKGAVGAALMATASGAVVAMVLPGGTKPPTVASSAPARLAVTAFAAPPPAPPGPYAYDQAAADLLARVRSFKPMTLSDINAVLGARLSGELTPAGGSASAGNLGDFLSLLAGRTFELAAGTQLFSAGKWVGGADTGSFSRPRKVYDSHMVQGMLVPYHLGGDDSPIEIGPARRTFPGSYFNASYVNGQLGRLNRAVQLRGNLSPERVVVIYTEDGSVV